MRSPLPLALGAPGIYQYPEAVSPALRSARMDVCAFVGVAPRGPVRIPKLSDTGCQERLLADPDYHRHRSVAVPVESWDAYKQLFGGFEGPGRLPYTVASFFEQGGSRAYIVRVVHEYGNPTDNAAGVAKGLLPNAKVSPGTFYLQARNEGRWGNALRAALGFSVTPISLLSIPTQQELIQELIIEASEAVLVGSLLRLNLPATPTEPAHPELRFVSFVRKQGAWDSGAAILRVALNVPVNVPEDATSEYFECIEVELIEGELKVIDGQGVVEHFKGLGLSSQHPRWMATVLFYESQLVYPDHSWVEGDIKPTDSNMPSLKRSLDSTENMAIFSEGEDRYNDITFEDFFDDGWTRGDPDPGDGVYALAHLTDLATVVVPDLYVPEPLPEQEDIGDSPLLASGRFETCVDSVQEKEETATSTPELENLYLDPKIPDNLEKITGLQERLAGFADKLRNFVVLLDVPPGLSHKKILRWRARFRSSYLAAYYPWLQVSNREDQRNALIRVNPSAVAAGIIATQEHQFGVPHGPANVIAEGVVKVDELISPAHHDELHPQGINVFLQQRDGVWLSAGRTLSRDIRYRQLSVRRLMLMLCRILRQQMQWAVFEPNGPALWADVRHLLNNYLRRLFAIGAFKGGSEEEAFFVRCDEELNTRRVIDAGQMIAEVGISPAEPLEFIVLRITRGGDGTLVVES